MSMRVLVWATSFGADLWSLARYLDQRSDVELKIVMPNLCAFQAEGVARLFPLRAELIGRDIRHHVLGAPSFRPDVTILDNRVPIRATSRAGFVLWHGFGWKGPNDRAEFRALHAALRLAWGDPLEPNPHFRWQCFGPWDLEHRTTVSGFHPDNCRVLGAASHDDLRRPLERQQLREFYPFDVVRKKTVLIAPTWHYGEVFAHWGHDAEIFERLLSHLGARDVNVILRMHDRDRFASGYARQLEQLASRHRHVLLKFKDEHPDNYLDLALADVLVTNYSSIANLFYATGRPTIHIYPVKSADEAFQWRQRTLLGTITKTVESARYVWKLPPEDNGGLLAHDFGSLLEMIDRGLDEPDCCRLSARDFLDRHMLGADGKSCERIWDALVELAETSR